MLNKRFVIDVGRIFGECQILDVELILRRLGRGVFAGLSRRLGGSRLVRCVFFRFFRVRDLKLFWDLSKRRDELKVDFPCLAEHVGRAIRRQLSLH